MVERREFKSDEELNHVADTSRLVISAEIRKEVEEMIRAGTIIIKEETVFYHDPLFTAYSRFDTYPVNLDAGYIKIEPPEGIADPPVIVPINLEPLAIVREMVGWQPPQPWDR